MPVPADVRRRCRQLLDQGESIRYLIPTLAAGVGVIAYAAECFIVVTDRRIVIVVGGTFRRHRPAQIAQEFPRSQRLGPIDTSLTPTIEFSGRYYEIAEEYLAAVAAADAELDGPDALPEDPFPEI